MTGYTVHSGSNDKFAEGWDRIFGAAGKPTEKASKAGTKAAKGKSSRSGKSNKKPKGKASKS